MANLLSSEQVVALDRAHVWHPYTPIDAWMSANEPPPIFERAEGVTLFARDGRSFIDGFGSWWVSNLGHGHPRLKRALHEQVEQFSHVVFAGATHEPAVRLASRLAAIAPTGLGRVFFSDNGSTSIEVALRASYQYNQQNGRAGRKRFVAFDEAYHGDTIGAMSLSGTRTFFERYAGIAFESIRVRSMSSSAPDAVGNAIERLEATLREHADEVCALVVEPLVQGAGGMLTWPPSALAYMRQLCDELDIFLIADEVFTGFGRTGTMFACEQAAITPDFMCLSKGLTGGSLPFAVTLCTERVFDGFRGSWDRTFWYGHSYCGSALGCAAANAVLDAFELDGVLAAAQPRITQLQSAFADLGGLSGVVESRGVGMVAALQLGARADYRDDVGWRVARAALPRGLFIRPLGNVVYLCPALTITESELDRALAILDESLRAVL